MRRRLIVASVAVLVVAGVGVGFLTLSASNGGQGESMGTPSAAGDLIVATHPEGTANVA